MAEAAVAAQIAGKGVQAAGSIYQGNADANIADYNAQIATHDAAEVEAQGAEEARRSLVNSRKYIGAGVAAYGASGVTSNGSAQWVLREGAAQGELNALTIQNNADVKATAYKNEAALDTFRGQNYRTRGYIGAASSILSMAGTSGGGGGSSGGSDDLGDVVE